MSLVIRDKVRFYSILLNVVLLLTCGFFLNQWLNKPCPSCDGEIVRIKHDTIYPAPILKPIIAKVPEAYKVIAAFKKPARRISPVSVSADSSGVAGASVTQACEYIAEPSACDSIRFYLDSSLVVNDHRLYIKDTVEGKLTGRSVWYVNMKPEVITTTEKVHAERLKFYLGASVIINQRYLDRWGIGPSALLTIPKIGGISYSFDAKNFAHTGTFYALIRFR